MNEMEWITEIPTKEGWYWAWPGVDRNGNTVCEIVRVSTGVMSVERVGWESDFMLSKFTHWLGPLPNPEHPQVKP